MATPTAPIASDQPTVETAAPAAQPRRTVTLSVVPLAIIGAIVIALLFFAGGTALGFALAGHQTRVGIIQPFGGQNNGQNGFGQNGGHHGGQNGPLRPGNSPTGAPQNG
jgi:hypothetical protein